MEFSARSVILLGASLGVSSATAFAQNYPTKPIRFARVLVQDPSPGPASIPPKVLEAIRCKLRVSHGVLDVLVAEVVL
jgi:pimeloyl-ACP methyl ester carboxylesterase